MRIIQLLTGTNRKHGTSNFSSSIRKHSRLDLYGWTRHSLALHRLLSRTWFNKELENKFRREPISHWRLCDQFEWREASMCGYSNSSSSQYKQARHGGDSHWRRRVFLGQNAEVINWEFVQPTQPSQEADDGAQIVYNPYDVLTLWIINVEDLFRFEVIQ